MKSDVKGFTLVELLVTLAMTAIITASVYGIFGVQAQRKAVEQKSIEMQQNVRVAMERIARDMRMTGFWGCMTPGNFKNTVRGQEGDALLQMTPVFGINNAAADNAYGARQGTDILVLSYANGDSGIPVDPPYMNTNSADIHLASAGDLEKGDVVLVTDCEFTSVFQITQINDSGRSCVHNSSQGNGTPNPGNSEKDLGHKYGAGSYVYPIGAKYYWVTPQNELKASMGGFDTTTNTFRTDFNTQTIAENIEDMQLQYGVDSNSDGRPDQWNPAAGVSDWNSVIGVQIFLLAKSSKMEKDYTNNHVYAFADRPAAGPYNDRYHRLLLQRLITLRNRTM